MREFHDDFDGIDWRRILKLLVALPVMVLLLLLQKIGVQRYGWAQRLEECCDE